MTETTWPFGTTLSELLQRQQDVLAFFQAEGHAGRQAVCPRCPGAGLASRRRVGCQVCHWSAGCRQFAVPLRALVSPCIKQGDILHAAVKIFTDLEIGFNSWQRRCVAALVRSLPTGRARSQK